MQPEVVTFWHGRLDRLRLTCLRSQLAAGHKVTVYSFDPIAGLPEGVVNAEAEAILPHAFSERLRPPQPDGSWRDWTTLQFSDFFRMRLMAERAGLWLDADVLLLKPVEIDPAKPLFAWERPRQLGNSVLYLPPDDRRIGNQGREIRRIKEKFRLGMNRVKRFARQCIAECTGAACERR